MKCLGKYNELMQTLEGSNVAFDKAKSDMEKMNAQLIKLQGKHIFVGLDVGL